MTASSPPARITLQFTFPVEGGVRAPGGGDMGGDDIGGNDMGIAIPAPQKREIRAACPAQLHDPSGPRWGSACRREHDGDGFLYIRFLAPFLAGSRPWRSRGYRIV